MPEAGENMNFISRFVAFWYDFIVGDDWVLAVGVLAILAVGAAAARSGAVAVDWLVPPIGIALILAISLRRAISTH